MQELFPKQAERLKFWPYHTKCLTEIIHHAQKQRIPSNIQYFSAPLSPNSKTMHDTKTCGAVAELENSNTPKHNRY